MIDYFPKRKLNLTITILTILRIFLQFFIRNPPYQNSFHRKSTIYIYIHKTNYITNSPPIKYYSALLRISFDPSRKYNTYNAKPNKTNYHKFYRASFKNSILQNPDIPSRISTLHVQNSRETSSRRESRTETTSNFISPCLQILLFFFFFETRLALSPPSLHLSPSRVSRYHGASTQSADS